MHAGATGHFVRRTRHKFVGALFYRLLAPSDPRYSVAGYEIGNKAGYDISPASSVSPPRSGLTSDCGGKFLAVNTGSSDWNVQIKDLAAAVSKSLAGTSFSVNKEASPDKRSYRVNFDLFKALAPDHQPLWDLPATIKELNDGLSEMNFADANFRESQFIRLKVLARLRDRARLDGDLLWTGK